MSCFLTVIKNALGKVDKAEERSYFQCETGSSPKETKKKRQRKRERRREGASDGRSSIERGWSAQLIVQHGRRAEGGRGQSDCWGVTSEGSVSMIRASYAVLSLLFYSPSPSPTRIPREVSCHRCIFKLRVISHWFSIPNVTCWKSACAC